MASKLTRGVLFLSSYFPLVLIFCILQLGKWPLWAVALLFGVFGIGSLLGTWFYFWFMRHRGYVERKKVINFSKRDSEVMSYIASYLIPFVTFPLDTLQQLAAVFVFIVVLLTIYVRSNMIYINPVLNVVGYHLYEVEIEHSQQPHYFIARKPLERNREVRFVRLSDDIYLEK